IGTALANPTSLRLGPTSSQKSPPAPTTSAAAGQRSHRRIAAKLPCKRFVQRAFTRMRAPPSAPLDSRRRLFLIRLLWMRFGEGKLRLKRLCSSTVTINEASQPGFLLTISVPDPTAAPLFAAAPRNGWPSAPVGY